MGGDGGSFLKNFSENRVFFKGKVRNPMPDQEDPIPDQDPIQDQNSISDHLRYFSDI